LVENNSSGMLQKGVFVKVASEIASDIEEGKTTESVVSVRTVTTKGIWTVMNGGNRQNCEIRV
jgi:hypothetical protein